MSDRARGSVCVTVEVVAACERLRSAEIYQSWLWSVLGIAKRRGGAMVGSAELEGMYRYREHVVVIVDFLFGPGAAVASSIGQRLAMRLKEAFEATAFVVSAAAGSRRGVEHHVSEDQARALVELRKSTQRVVDALLSVVRVEQELPLERGGGGENGSA